MARFVPGPPSLIITLTIRDRDHFYAVVKWCNSNAGKGAHFWTSNTRILKFVDPAKATYNPPRDANFRFYVGNIDIASLLAL